MNAHTHTHTVRGISPKSMQYLHIYCILEVRLEMSLIFCLQVTENKPKYGNQ